jgi:hypothetical protein
VIDGFSFGYSGSEQEMWCIHRDDDPDDRMLCGRKVGFIPVVQPAHPRSVHAACLRVMYGNGQVERPEAEVECPACHQGVPVADGRIGSHRDLGNQACVGVNLPAGGWRR